MADKIVLLPCIGISGLPMGEEKEAGQDLFVEGKYVEHEEI